MPPLPRRQRVAAYAVILRGDQILLSRLAPHISRDEQWTLPGGGLDHGEDPRSAVVREVYEETGLRASVGETARVYSTHLPRVRRDGRTADYHALRIVYEAWVAADAAPPQVVEVDGSTVAAAWHDISAVLNGEVPTAAMVTEAVGDLRPVQVQRTAAYALITRGEDVLLTRFSARGPFPGRWGLPGGGLQHGESPMAAVSREVAEETSLEGKVGPLVVAHSDHFTGTAPSGRHEDFHAVSLVYAVSIPDGGAEPAVADVGGTTDAVAWVARSAVLAEEIDVLDVVRVALEARQ